MPNRRLTVPSSEPTSVAPGDWSEAKRFATDAAWEVVNLAMQIIGGNGYATVFPIERLLRDTRLTQIWTGTNESREHSPLRATPGPRP